VPELGAAVLYALFSGIVTGLVFVVYIAVVGMMVPARRTKPVSRRDPPRRKRGKQGVIWIHLEADRGLVQPAPPRAVCSRKEGALV